MDKQYHLWVQGSTTPTVYNDISLLYEDINKIAGPFVVHHYDLVRTSTHVYNIPGGEPVPSCPKPEPRLIEVITHIKKKG